MDNLLVKLDTWVHQPGAAQRPVQMSHLQTFKVKLIKLQKLHSLSDSSNTVHPALLSSYFEDELKGLEIHCSKLDDFLGGYEKQWSESYCTNFGNFPKSSNSWSKYMGLIHLICVKPFTQRIIAKVIPWDHPKTLSLFVKTLFHETQKLDTKNIHKIWHSLQCWTCIMTCQRGKKLLKYSLWRMVSHHSLLQNCLHDDGTWSSLCLHLPKPYILNPLIERYCMLLFKRYPTTTPCMSPVLVDLELPEEDEHSTRKTFLSLRMWRVFENQLRLEKLLFRPIS